MRILIGLALIIAGIVTFVACNGPNIGGIGGITPSGQMTDGEFAVTEVITEIRINGIPSRVNISPAHDDLITYEIDTNLEDFFEISLRNGVLRISLRGNRGINAEDGNIGDLAVINIGTDDLSRIEASSIANIYGTDLFIIDELEIELSGMSSVNLELDANEIEVDVSGMSNVTLAGSADELNLDISGMSAVDTIGLLARDVRAEVSGMSTADVYAVERIRAEASGMSTINVYGSPANVTERTSGMSSIDFR